MTGAAVLDVGRRGGLEAREAGVYLVLFSVLFLLRVAAQIVVVLRAPAWLPPISGEKWNLVPYRILLPIQLVFLIIMGAIDVGLLREQEPFVVRHVLFGRVLIVASCVYAGVMAVRYVVRMARQPAERWFGGAIPIVFHMVLAAFLFTWGRYHVSR
jgi:hypothetical protein